MSTVTSEREAFLTVDAVLHLQAVRQGVPEVMAGRDNLRRPVRWVHAGEVPNMPALLKGGELLLTTGMGVGTTPRDQRRFIEALSERGVAALAIELGTALATMPKPLIEEAGRRGLPLVALHREVPFVEITEAVHRETVNRQFAAMRRGDELHRRFTELMLEGAEIPEVLSGLAETVANPVMLKKSGGEILYHATHDAGDRAVFAAHDAVRRGVPDAPEAISQGVPMGGRELWGQVIVLAVDSPLDDFDRIAIQQAVGLLALALLRNRQEELLAARQRGDFLTGLLEGNVDEAEAANRAASLGFDQRTGWLLPLTIARGTEECGAGFAGGEGMWALLWRDVARELQARHTRVIAGTRVVEHEMLVVVGLGRAEEREGVADRATDVVRGAAARHFGYEGSLTICIGPTARSWSALRAGLRACVDALPAASRAPLQRWHDVTRPDLDRLLWSLRHHPDFLAFLQTRLEPIIDHDRRRAVELMPTLAAYCAHGGRKAETARALHIERQSIYHRIARIEQLLGESLADEDTRLGLHLALRARSYLDGASDE